MKQNCHDCRNWTTCTELDQRKAEAQEQCEGFKPIDWSVLGDTGWT